MITYLCFSNRPPQNMLQISTVGCMMEDLQYLKRLFVWQCCMHICNQLLRLCWQDWCCFWGTHNIHWIWSIPSTGQHSLSNKGFAVTCKENLLTSTFEWSHVRILLTDWKIRSTSIHFRRCSVFAKVERSIKEHSEVNWRQTMRVKLWKQ